METTMQLPDQQVFKFLILKSDFIKGKYSYRAAMEPVKVSLSLCIVIDDGNERAKIKWL